jgi:hypothetical protein
MGKKPLVGLIGLVCAGMALTGCGESCRKEARDKYNATPSFPTRNTPADKSVPLNPTTTSTNTETRSTNAITPPPTKPMDSTSSLQPTGGFNNLSKESGLKTVAATPTASTAPANVESLRLKDDRGLATTTTLPPRRDGMGFASDLDRPSDPKSMKIPNAPSFTRPTGAIGATGEMPANPMPTSDPMPSTGNTAPLPPITKNPTPPPLPTPLPSSTFDLGTSPQSSPPYLPQK